MTDPPRSRERNAEIDRLFAAALDMDDDERDALLAGCRARDPGLARAVERLLAAAARPDPRLDPDRWAERSDWSSLGAPSAGPATAGERVGAYRILREIGRGGMSVVYLAERADGAFEQLVVLKFLGVAHELGVRRFERERQILAGLNHPNIARLLDGGSDDRGRPFIVMEYVAGRPIDRYCAERDADIARRIELVATVAGAVEYAHANLVVHRDIKPSNVLVTDDGEVKLLDFGIAKLLSPDGFDDAAVPQTATMVRVLTPEYASPEQVRGERITTASDVYQLGMLLYELLSGQRPFALANASASEIERVVCGEDPAPPSRAVTRPPAAARAADMAAMRRRLRGDLDTIVLKALEKDAGRRYPSARALIEDLGRFRSGRPISARPPTLRYRASRFLYRNRVSVAAAALVGVSLLAGIGATSWQAVVASRERDRAERARLHAESVSDFLVDIFEVSDPERSANRDVSARELLDRGARQVDHGLDDPRLSASLMTVIGRAYRSLGLYDEAEPLLESAVALRRAAGDDIPALAATLDQLGRLRFEQRRLDDADALYHEALELHRVAHGAEHTDVAVTLRNLSELRLLERNLDSAEHLARASLEMRRRLLGDDAAAVAAAHTDLGRVHLFRGDLAAAGEHFAEAAARQRRLLPRPSRDLATTLNHLGQVRHNEGRHDEAGELYTEAHTILVELLGADHPQTADTHNNLGVLHYTRGSYEDAVAVFRDVLAARERTLGAGHPLLAHTLHNLASVARMTGDVAQAESGFVAALDIRRNAYGSDHVEVALSLWGLAHLRRDQQRLEEAELAFREAVDIYRRILPPTHTSLGRILVDHGAVLLQLGRTAAAEAQLAEGLHILEVVHELGDDRVHDARRQLEEARSALTRTAGTIAPGG